MTDVVKQAHDAVVDEMITQKKLRTDQAGKDAIDYVIKRTLGQFLQNDPDFWAKPGFKEFILSVADDIVNASTDLAYVRRRNPKNHQYRPPVIAEDIKDAARAVMVRRHEECSKFFRGDSKRRGLICDPYLEETALTPTEATETVTV